MLNQDDKAVITYSALEDGLRYEEYEVMTEEEKYEELEKEEEHEVQD